MNIYGYTRVSTTRQSDEGLSIEAQDERVRGYASGMLQTDITNVFNERGVSASIPFHKRPMGQELLATVQPGDVIVALRLDRVFRSALDCLRMVEELRERKVKLCLVDMGDVTENGFARVFMTIAASFAELEKEKIRERTLEVHAYRRSLGKHVAGRVPFGYTMRKDGFLVEDLAQQKALKRMRKLRVAGKSYRAIRADLCTRFGLTLSAFGIQRILSNKRKLAEDAIRQNAECTRANER
jgi:DNA invertase Pin-like site-specific DNA recombinase